LLCFLHELCVLCLPQFHRNTDCPICQGKALIPTSPNNAGIKSTVACVVMD
jgi:hypothetical protein